MSNKNRVKKVVSATLAGGLLTFAATMGTMAQADTIDAATQTQISQLASTIASLSSLASQTGISSDPVFTVMANPSFDWNEVMFGTDSPSTAQQQAESSLNSDLVQISTLSATTTTSATSLIDSVITNMETLNSDVKAADVVSFLQIIVNNGASEVSTLNKVTPMTGTAVAAAMHPIFAGEVAQASSAIQAIFNGTVGAGTGTSAGAGAGGSTGTGSSSTGAGSTSTGGSSSSTPSKKPNLKPNQRAILLNGKAVVVPASVHNQTTYVPIWYVMHMMESLGYTSHWNGSTWYLTTPGSVTPNLTQIHSGAGHLAIYLDGHLVQRVNGLAAADPSTGNATTFMPIWYVMQMLKRINVQSTWDGTTWGLTVGK